MTMRVEWRNGHASFPDQATVLVAFPGVGNIGKVAVDSISELHDSMEIARLHPVGLPPHAHLDEDGLLAPPHLSLRKIQTSKGASLVTLTGKTQPTEPSQQSVLATEVMAFLELQNTSTVLVLAGMFDKPENKETFAVASSSSFRIDMETMGVDVRRDQPRSGAIGLPALLASMGPLYNINSACVIATTVGSSGDIMGSQRIIEHLERWFGYGLTVPTNGGDWLRERLESMAPSEKDDLVKEMTASHDAFYM
jgi:proteasome assembly chaperone (PAC2) family protein